MNSLVADYGTSSGESDDEASSDDCSPDTKQERETFTKLPKPDFLTSSSENSVFKNPFVEAENAKKAILEKHVKMVPTKDKVQMINGKKICWNYRKGRCRFGHNCTFAHDTDLHRTKDDEKIQPPAISENLGNQCEQVSDIQDDQNRHLSTKKKRPGLSNNIVPSKKVMKMYKQSKMNDTK